MAPFMLSAGSTAAGYLGQSQQANANANYQNQMYAQTGKNALANYDQQTGVAGTRLIQQAAAMQQQGMDQNRQMMQAQGHAAAAAGEAGVAGNSVNALMNDFSSVASSNIDTLRTNQQYSVNQMGQDEKAMRANAQNQIAQAAPQPVQRPSLLGSLMEIAGGAYKAKDGLDYMRQQGIYNKSDRASTLSYGQPISFGGFRIPNIIGIRS